jgi:predicted N-acetyltransferase YhbS
VILVGDAPYYERFGFSRAGAQALDLPGPVDPARFLALELQPGALAGAAGLVRATGALAPSKADQRLAA